MLTLMPDFADELLCCSFGQAGTFYVSSRFQH
jgi:hypothetical protein